MQNSEAARESSTAAQKATSESTPNVTLDNCHEEPIHIPGLIQPHGYLFVLSPKDLSVRHISENAVDILGVERSEICGETIGVLLGSELHSAIQECVEKKDFHRINPVRVVVMDKTFDGIVSHSEAYIILDLEISQQQSKLNFETHYQQMRDFLNTVSSAQTDSELFDRVAREVRAITGFDRVMVYQFDKDFNGEVVAEAKKAELNSFLKQHFPESDIPAQARALYIKNRIRLLADVDAAPVPLYPNDEHVDLGSSALRSVSPIHLQYLRNMGVAASMSISITIEDRLWGLIACHHYEPRLVPFQQRDSAAYLGLTLSHLISVMEREKQSVLELKSQTALTAVIENISNKENLIDGLRCSTAELLTLVNASGVAWRLGLDIETAGVTPQPGEIERIYDFFSRDADINDSLLLTDCMALKNENFVKHAKVASGVLILPLSIKEGHFLMWFRKELIQTKNWGGKPEKVIEFRDDGSHRLMPRSSFSLWKERVRNHAQPWSDIDTVSALKMRNTVVNHILLQSEKLKAVNQTLEQRVKERTAALEEQVRDKRKAQRELKKALTEARASNKQLEQFAYVASHDLQEPLRKIQSFGSRIEKLIVPYDDPMLKNYLERMVSAAHRMQTLIKDLLSFSRINRTTEEFKDVALNDLLAEVISDINLLIGEKNATVSVGELQKVSADKNQLYRVFQNLLQNSLKFSSPDKVPHIRIDIVSETATRLVYRVADNGIGFEQKYSDRIFDLFQRLHGRNEYEGTGLGLAICKRIMERHGGRIWAESTPNEGTSMFLQFNKYDNGNND